MFRGKNDNIKTYNFWSSDQKNKIYKSLKDIDDLSDYDEIELYGKFNESLEYLPNNIKRIYWSSQNNIFNLPLDNLPSQLVELNLSSLTKFNQKLIRLPSGLKKIKLCESYTHSLETLPENLEYLSIHDNYNIELANLPCNLKTLVIPRWCKYNKSLDNLPLNLENLIIYGEYIPKLNNLPCGLKKLYIESCVTRNDKNNLNLEKLPDQLEVLCISISNFNSSLDNLPSKLKKLTIISQEFNQKIDNLPSNLEFLSLDLSDLYNYDLLNLPENLKTLKIIGINKQIQLVYPHNLLNLEISSTILAKNMNIPETITSLYIQSTTRDANIELTMGPELKYFKCEIQSELTIKKFSNCLESFIVNTCFNQLINDFPKELKTLVIDNIGYKFELNGLPDSLEKLYYRVKNDYPIPVLPPNLKSFYFGSKVIFNNDFELPKGLEYIGIDPILFYNDSMSDDEYNEYIKECDNLQSFINTIPDNVKYMSINFDIKLFDINHLPNNLREIFINDISIANSDFNLIEHFKKGGCNNNFDSIYIFEAEDRTDLKFFRSIMNQHFKTNNNVYQIDCTEEYW